MHKFISKLSNWLILTQWQCFKAFRQSTHKLNCRGSLHNYRLLPAATMIYRSCLKWHLLQNKKIIPTTLMPIHSSINNNAKMINTDSSKKILTNLYSKCNLNHTTVADINKINSKVNHRAEPLSKTISNFTVLIKLSINIKIHIISHKTLTNTNKLKLV